jgi:hypothetical protein
MTLLRWLIRLQIEVARLGWLRAVALVLLLAATVAWSLWLPALQRRDRVDGASLATLQKRLAQVVPAAPAAAPKRDRVAEFYDALGERRHADQQLKTIFTLAQKNGVAIAAAEYKTGYDKNSHVHTWQIALPVRASYPALRHFSEQVLLAIPFAALDELRFRREAIASPLLDARLRFTLYLADAPAPAAARDR